MVFTIDILVTETFDCYYEDKVLHSNKWVCYNVIKNLCDIVNLDILIKPRNSQKFLPICGQDYSFFFLCPVSYQKERVALLNVL